MFVIDISYSAELDQIEQHLEQHKRYLDKHYALNNFLISGRKEPRSGGIIVSPLSDKAALEAVLAEDVFFQRGLADYRVTEFIASRTAPELQYLID